jgi:leucyl-tRNA synthetase
MGLGYKAKVEIRFSLVDNQTIFPLELNTMPGWAGSSFYWMRYMDAQNEKNLEQRSLSVLKCRFIYWWKRTRRTFIVLPFLE